MDPIVAALRSVIEVQQIYLCECGRPVRLPGEQCIGCYVKALPRDDGERSPQGN